MCHVHDPSLYVTLVSHAEHVIPASAKVTAAQQRLVEERRQREALEFRQRVKEEEFQQQFAAARQGAEQREKASKEAEDRAFEERFATLMANRDGFLKDLQSELQEVDAEQQKRKETLHRTWTEQVFIPIQTEIHAKVTALPDRSFSSPTRRQWTISRGAMSPTGALGDSLDQHMGTSDLRPADSLRYTVRVQDPLQSSLGVQFQADFDTSSQGAGKREPPRYRSLASPLEYLRPEATPNGRYAEPVGRVHKKPPAVPIPKHDMVPDDYEHMPPSELRTTLLQELKIGKRVVGPNESQQGSYPTGRRALPGPISQLISF